MVLLNFQSFPCGKQSIKEFTEFKILIAEAIIWPI